MKTATMFCGFILLMFVCSVNLFADISVTISEPAEGALVTPCSDIVIKFDYNTTAGEEVKQIYLYYNGRTKGRVTKEPWEILWKSIPTGKYELTARLVTTDNVEVWSDTVQFKVGKVASGELLFNGGFDCGILAPWRSNTNDNGEATFTIYDDAYFEDPHYLAVEIDQIGVNRWSVQLFNQCPLDSGHTYEASFMADALEKKTIYMGFQEAVDPWTTQFGTEIEIGGSEFLYGPFEFIASRTDPTNDLVFHFGGDETPVFLDNVQVIDKSATSVKMRKFDFEREIPSEYELFQAYPNPFNMNTKIDFRLSKPAKVSLVVYDMTGRKIKTLLSGSQTNGMSSITWNGRDQNERIVSSGVYVYQLLVENGSFQQVLSRKVVLLK